MESVKDKLLKFQITQVNNLTRIIQNNKAVLDASDTGTGKTYTAIASCKILKLYPLIICPKSVMSTWDRVCKYFDVEPFFIVNYETIKMGKFYNAERDRISCPYINYIEDAKTGEYYYQWLVDDPRVIFIFDEVHRCSNVRSHNGQLLYAAKELNLPIMVLSATVADYPEKFQLFFWILNFIDPESVKRNNLTYDKYIGIISKWISRDPKPMLRIHNMLYPNRASRMRIDALGDLFPATQIIASPYSMGKKREEAIERHYSVIAEQLDILQDKSKKGKTNSLVQILRAHQKIEMLKVPTFVELANDFIENGFSVVIFVNFTQTLKLLAKMLNTKYVIYGQQTQEERDTAINLFNENRIKIIICNIKAGGIGISLHDTNGGYPRASIISPTWSSIDLIQALGRIHRAGGKSKSLQRIVYAANTVEEQIADKLKLKLNNLNSINNGDLDISNLSTSIKFEKKF